MSRKEKEANFWMKFVVNDWLADPHLSACAPATRGIWMDVICNLHNMRQPMFAASDAAWARMCRCAPSEIQVAFYELRVSGTATVVEEQGIFTVTSRRMEREMEIAGVRREAAGASWESRRANDMQSASKRDANVAAKDMQNPNSNSSFNSFSQGEVQERDEPMPERTRKPSQDELLLVYHAYPRLVGRAKALDEIGKAVVRLAGGGMMPPMTTAAALAFLHGKAAAFAASPAGKQGDYTPHPSTWFHQERYFDNEQEWQRSGDGGRGNGSTLGNRPTTGQQRSANSDAAIFSAWSDLAGPAGACEAGVADEGELPLAGGDRGDGGSMAGGLDGARAAVRHGGGAGRAEAAPRVIEIPAVPGGHRGVHFAGAAGEAYAARC